MQPNETKSLSMQFWAKNDNGIDHIKIKVIDIPSGEWAQRFEYYMFNLSFELFVR